MPSVYLKADGSANTSRWCDNCGPGSKFGALDCTAGDNCKSSSPTDVSPSSSLQSVKFMIFMLFRPR